MSGHAAPSAAARGSDDVGRSVSDVTFVAAVARRLAQPDDADDLAQDAWLAVHSEQVTAPRPRRWLTGVVRNRWLMRRRSDSRRKNRERIAARMPITNPASAEEVAQRDQLLRSLREAIETLKPADQSLIKALYLEEQPAQKLALTLGVPASTIRTRASRALGRLRAQMDERCGGDRSVWALCFFGSPDRCVTPTVATAATLSTAKVGLLVAAGTAVAAMAVWEPDLATAQVDSSNESVRDSALVASATQAADVTAPATVHGGSQASPPMDPTKLARLLAPDADPDELDEIAALLAADIAEAVELGELSPGIATVFEALAGQGFELYLRCSKDDASTPKQRLVVQARLLPDANEDGRGVVDTVEVITQQSVPNATAQCLRESLHTVDFVAPTDAVFDTYQFNVFGDESGSSFSVGGKTTPTNIVAVLDRYPSDTAQYIAEAERTPELRDALALAAAKDPSLIARHPAVAGLLADTN